MWTYLIIFIVSVALMVGIGSCIPGKSRVNGFTENDSAFYPIDTTTNVASREDVELRLKLLAESSPPANLDPGAMCYEMSMPPDRVEYVCPVCGEKTLYTTNDMYNEVENAVSCRQYVATIKNLDLRLEEKNFCRKCDPDTNQSPQVNLYIKYKGEEQEERVENISPEGLQLIQEFMSGDKTHSYFNDREEPLKNYVDQIRDLLKIKKP
jgi:hypothetical protein